MTSNKSKLFPGKPDWDWTYIPDSWVGKGLLVLFLILVGVIVILLSFRPVDPEVTILSGGESWVNSTEGILIFMASDNSGGTLTCDIELNGLVVRTVSAPSGVEVEEALTLAMGTNQIRVKATDSVGNSAWSNVYTVHVDAEPPDIVIIDFRAAQ